MGDGQAFDSAGEILAEARRVLELEAASITALTTRLDQTFERAISVLEGTTGRVIVSGVGKSGIVARKIASTLTSTGTPATFLHPVEGLHGDLGLVQKGDSALCISKSGESGELAGMVEYLVRHGIPMVALTGDPKSTLATDATVVLDCSVAEEACPFDLAPTSSTTAALALGDALAVVLLQRKGFRESDFAQIHPGGALGRRLTLRVAAVMIDEGVPSVREHATMRDTIVPLAEQRGTVPVVDAARHVVGIITAGDLTRLMERREDFFSVPVSEVMTRTPKTIRADELGSAAVRVMEEYGIMALPVVDDDERLCGIVHLHDLMRSGAAG